MVHGFQRGSRGATGGYGIEERRWFPEVVYRGGEGLKEYGRWVRISGREKGSRGGPEGPQGGVGIEKRGWFPKVVYRDGEGLKEYGGC